MAKWDSEKIEKEIRKAEEENRQPILPVRSERPYKLSKEETIRRYDKG